MTFGTANGTCFCCMISVGFDAAVVGGVSLTLKKLISKGAYVVEALRALWSYRDQLYSIRADGRDLSAYGAIVSLTPFYAGHYVIAPKASPFAPDFALVLFKGKGRLNLLRYAGALALGKMDTCRGVEIISAQEIEISAERPADVQADGDILCELPLRLSRAGQITILAPAG
jgi:diacylglycerol kinase family enzyme